ncbi:MAG: hypothetical protein WBC26_04515, partial [Alphaproteobacteria bacterium]
LIALSDELMLADPKTLNQQKPRLLTIFEQNASRVSWDNIRSFARYLFRQRREGRIITPDIIATVPDKTEDIALIKETFRKLSEAYSTMENGRKTDGKETATGNITSFISPNALK